MKPLKQIRILENAPGGVRFTKKIAEPICADGIDILQINVGKRCNLSCKHCHVEAGPDRTEVMDRKIFETCLDVLAGHPIGTIDITGGSPEMNPDLPWFIEAAAKLNRRVMVRSNLVILLEEPYRRFIDLYADHGVEVVTSLPAYTGGLVDRQRGNAAFEKIISAMQRLNRKGYGRPGSGLVLNLVHNPVGAFLPGSQESLTYEYRHRLEKDHGVFFNSLFCITNCPVGRYLEFLVRTDNYEGYMNTLINAFNRSAVPQVMCRTTVSIGWDGRLYDCDFNQMLELTVNHGAPDHISRFDMARLRNRRIVIGNHCFSCTAGAGSSCQGALSDMI